MNLFDGNTTGIATIILVVTFAFVAVITVLTASIVSLRKSRYDMQEGHAVLSAFREAYDTKSGNLALEALATPSRWKDANHLLISALNKEDIYREPTTTPNEFLSSFGIKPKELVVDPDLVFVLTPFNRQEMAVFRTIKSVCDATGFRAMRGDEENIEGDILGHIVRQIVKSRVVIANIGSRNPNVFYELGIAHALSKPTILVSRTIADAPFDIQNRRIVIYSNKEELEKNLALALVRLNRTDAENQKISLQSSYIRKEDGTIPRKSSPL